MADARVLLRSQRETRRINHPHASYTGSGRLLCTVCNTTIKSEQFWPNHLRNPDHAARIQKLQSASITQSNKKRKADDDDDETSDVDEGRKRMKVTDEIVEAALAVKPVAVEQPVVQQMPTESNAVAQTLATMDASTSIKTTPAVEEDAEWLELQRAIDSSNVPSSKPLISSSATISAPAMSAEEIAAQAREEQSVQRGRRDEELVAEKEDAVRALQDEFQEMEELEDRVRRMREKREALRVGRPVGEDMVGSGITTTGETTMVVEANAESDDSGLSENNASGTRANQDGASMKNNEEDDDDDDDDEDEDFDSWTFGVQ